MTTYIPADITNIILEYYSQMRDMKWAPFIDIKTGKLKWRVNKYSAKYDNIHKLLKHRKEHLRNNINIDINILANGVTLDSYNRMGTCIVLKIEHIVKKYQIIIPKTYLYIEYFDTNKFKHSIFCSIFGKSTLYRFDYDVYQDRNIHSMLIDISKFGNNNYSLVLEKY